MFFSTLVEVSKNANRRVGFIGGRPIASQLYTMLNEQEVRVVAKSGVKIW